MTAMVFHYDDVAWPCLSWSNVHRKWILREELLGLWNNIPLLVPAGFLTDLASIPKFVRPLLPVNDRHIYPAILHDFGYRRGFRHLGLIREDVDAAFLDAMRATNLEAWKRGLIYPAVRGFAGPLFDREPEMIALPA